MAESPDTCSGEDANISASSDGCGDHELCIRINRDVLDNSDKIQQPRKNKRKMSEPRRLSDFSSKRFCPDSPNSLAGSLEAPEDCPPEISDSLDDSHELNNNDGSPFDPDLDANRLPPGVIPVPQGFEYPSLGYYMHADSVDGMLRPGNPSPSSFYQCDGDGDDDDSSARKARKNYKSMTLERRIEANARERSRVHTISAAFENLRRAVPSYSYNQKLSKLAILRIACCYILSLSRLAEMDYSRDQSRPSFGECVDLCTRTIQTEGRAKKRH